MGNPGFQTVRELADVLRQGPYTSIGSYPVFFLAEDGSTYSYAFVLQNFRTFAAALRDRNRHTHLGDCVRFADVNWETDMTCDGSGEPIEKAY